MNNKKSLFYIWNLWYNMRDNAKEGVYMAETNKKTVNTSTQSEQKSAHVSRSQRRERWIDESGRLEEYFQVGKNLIATKKDYFVVLDKYAESGLATRTFCQKYGIVNVVGFEKAVERRREEDPEYDERVSIALKKSAKHAIASTIAVVTNTKKDKNALGEAIKSGELEGVNLDKFIAVCEKLDKAGTNLADTMTKLIARYYYDRLNSYNSANNNADLKDLLNNNEIAFISPSGEEKIHEQKAFGVDTYPSEYFIRKMTRLRKSDPKLYSVCVVGKNPTTIESGLKKYNYKFDMDEFLKAKNEYIIDGNVVTVMPEDVHLAVAFAEMNDIYPGNGAIREIIRAVKTGKVKPTKALTTHVETMLAEKAKPKPDFESVDDYFSV